MNSRLFMNSLVQINVTYTIRYISMNTQKPSNVKAHATFSRSVLTKAKMWRSPSTVLRAPRITLRYTKRNARFIM